MEVNMAGIWSLYISSIGVPTRLKNTVVLKTWRGNSQEVNTIRILLVPRLSGGEYSRHLICIRARTFNAEPPYTAIISILPITHAGVFFVFWYFGFSESVYFASLYFRIFAFYFWAAAFSHYVHSLLHITLLGFITTLSWCLHTSQASIFHRMSVSDAILK